MIQSCKLYWPICVWIGLWGLVYSESLSDYIFIGSGKFCYVCLKSIWLQFSFRRLACIILLFVKVNLVDPLKSELSLWHENSRVLWRNLYIFLCYQQKYFSANVIFMHRSQLLIYTKLKSNFTFSQTVRNIQYKSFISIYSFYNIFQPHTYLIKIQEE